MWTKYFSRFPENITEGGGARNAQIARAIAKHKCTIYNYKATTKLKRIIHGIIFMARLNFYKNENILLHYSLLTYFFGKKTITAPHTLRAINLLLSSATKKNKITIEVNDLPYEQAVDLELEENSLWELDSIIFKLTEARFIFASRNMMIYVSRKYSTDINKCNYIINGGPSISSPRPRPRQNSRLKFLYAGTLNRGRQIESLISIFSGIEHELILMGEGGEWILTSPEKGDNIIYKGAMSEADAHLFATECDCGLIPYDSSRFYYNLCYPTKASFYVTAGITFISTQLDELQYHFSEDHAFFEPLNNWRQLITDVNFRDALRAKNSILLSISKKYEWDHLLRGI